MTAVRIPVEQGSPEWIAARRDLITATDLAVIMGLSPYKSEADLAAEKMGGESVPQSLPMKVGLALEPIIRAEYEARTGRRLRRYHGLMRHPSIAWAAASPDYAVIGERRLVEAKWTQSQSRFADGVPDDVAVQCIWQLGCVGYESADVAALIGGHDLKVMTVEHDEDTFAGLVTIAEDFRRRLAEGGPFAENAASVKARYPSDNGAEMVADADLAEAVHALMEYRAQRKHLESLEETIETAVKSRMGAAALLTGPDFKVHWKRTKDITQVGWEQIAKAYRQMIETTFDRFNGGTLLVDGHQFPITDKDRVNLDVIESLYTTVRPGFRPLRVVMKEKE